MCVSVCTCMCLCYRALQHVVEKCGSAFESHLTSDLMQLVFTCLSHTNRFVRETGYRVIAAIITIPGQYSSTYYLHTHTHSMYAGGPV